MTRAEYIQAVKVKLEEISPFDEPQSFIIADGDTDYDKVKPILSYIEETLDKAAVYCLTNLPIMLLSADVVKTTPIISIDGKGVGHLTYSGGLEYARFVRVQAEAWKRDCTMFISTADPLYLLQQNRYVRGGTAKPMVVLNPEQTELALFSFPPSLNNTEYSITLWQIPLYNSGVERAAETVASPIADYIVLACAAMVLDIMGNAQQAAVLRQQYNTQLESILH